VALAEDGAPRRLRPDPNDTHILVVDDEEGMRRTLVRLLERHGYRCGLAADPAEARARMQEQDYAVVLTDMNMPGGESGLDLIMDFRRTYPNSATVMITGVDDPDLANTALEVGAYGYVIKPFESNEILINVANALRRRALEIENRNHRARLEQMVRDRTRELWNAIAELEEAEKRLRVSQEETIERLSIAAEFRDDETARHIQRMSRYCAHIARMYGMDGDRCDLIRVASQMHDVGKIGIPDSILLKPGALTGEERSIMERHAEMGYQILCGSNSELLNVAATIAHTHHEKYDGSGYPAGLKATTIPIEGRIAAIADVFDALTSDRVYKKALPLTQAIEVMEAGRGMHFDPELLHLFLGSMDTVVGIKSELADT
jgi:putative two-component system response regulator